MEQLLMACRGISAGIVIGFLFGGFRLARRRSYTQKQQEAGKKRMGKIAFVLKYITIMMLVLGLVWCGYFLLLAIVQPAQADYANNMSELIVALLTVISIFFAFFEFSRRDSAK